MKKKVFAMLLVMVMAFTMLPLPGVHNHAHAASAGDPCNVDGCDCTSYESVGFGIGSMRLCLCMHPKKDHYVPVAECV